MNTPKAILIGFALVAAAILLVGMDGNAEAGTGGPKFQISSAAISWYFLLDGDTGKVAWCEVQPGPGPTRVVNVGEAKIICSKFQ